MNSAFYIHPASIHDARAIAEVHIASHQSAYRGIFPEALLKGLSVENRASAWRDLLAADAPPVTMVGSDPGGRVVAFVSGGKERTGQLGCDGETSWCGADLAPWPCGS